MVKWKIIMSCNLIKFSLMELYKSVNGAEFCHQFYPWYHKSAPYTLHGNSFFASTQVIYV